ncbi:hypothetical protein [Paenibacillus albidus]
MDAFVTFAKTMFRKFDGLILLVSKNGEQTLD